MKQKWFSKAMILNEDLGDSDAASYFFEPADWPDSVGHQNYCRHIETEWGKVRLVWKQKNPTIFTCSKWQLEKIKTHEEDLFKML